MLVVLLVFAPIYGWLVFALCTPNDLSTHTSHFALLRDIVVLKIGFYFCYCIDELVIMTQLLVIFEVACTSSSLYLLFLKTSNTYPHNPGPATA